MHIIASLDEKITAGEVDIYISNFLSYGIISEIEAKLLKVATSDNVLAIPCEYRDELRANILKYVIKFSRGVIFYVVPKLWRK